MDPHRQAVIVGVGRITGGPASAYSSPVGMVRSAVRLAAADALETIVTDARVEALLSSAVALGTPGMFTERTWARAFGKRPFKNFSKAVVDSIGAAGVKEVHCVRAYDGGNGPQYLVSYFAGMISSGNIPQGPIVVCGVEMNATLLGAVRKGAKEALAQHNGWTDGGKENDTVPWPTEINKYAKPTSARMAELLAAQYICTTASPALTLYPMLENAYAHSKGRSVDEQAAIAANLFSRFSIVAAAHPEHSWYPFEWSQERLLKTTKENRMIAYPYRKWMCARDEVDQSAAVIIMSLAEARRRGISEAKLVFIHGSGDAVDTNMLPLRRDLSDCAAMRSAYIEAFRNAGLGAPDEKKIAFFDFYSCFPIAVERACDCVGLDVASDVSRMTCTGGLAYHGGPGSNYSCHALCAVVEKLRLPRYRDKFAVVGANGGWLTEHSVGVYSTKAPSRTYERQARTIRAPTKPMDNWAIAPSGVGRLVTWTVRYGKRTALPEVGIAIVEMVSGPDAGKRCVCTTRSRDARDTCAWLLRKDRIGSEVVVSTAEEPVKFGRRQIRLVTFRRDEAKEDNARL